MSRPSLLGQHRSRAADWVPGVHGDMMPISIAFAWGLPSFAAEGDGATSDDGRAMLNTARWCEEAAETQSRDTSTVRTAVGVLLSRSRR